MFEKSVSDCQQNILSFPKHNNVVNYQTKSHERQMHTGIVFLCLTVSPKAAALKHLLEWRTGSAWMVEAGDSSLEDRVRRQTKDGQDLKAL